ncbi:hypothetical protein V2G26_004033 [Clonostachys chloroleuca]
MGSPIGTLNSAFFGDHSQYIPRIQERSDPTVFQYFQELPTELRLRIWHLYLGHQMRRLITIKLLHVVNAEESSRRGKLGQSLQYKNLNHLGNIVSGCNYDIIPRDPLYICPLLRVNREARHSVLCRYPIKAPLKSRKGLGERAGPLLHLNPEYDCIYIQSLKAPVQTLLGFLNDLRSYDSGSVGLLHLALDCRSPDILRCLESIKPETLLQVEFESFVRSLRNLRSLWGVYLLDDCNRIMLGSFSAPMNFKLGLIPAIPILAEVTDYKIFNPDPRPIIPDLKNIIIGLDPRPVVTYWKEMEARFGLDVEEASEPLLRKISYILAVDGTSNHEMCVSTSHDVCVSRRVCDSDSLKRYLIYEKNDLSRRNLWTQFLRQAEARQRQEQSAAGFWLFPEDSFENLPRQEDGNRIHDLTSRHPSLGLFRLG